MLPDKLLLEIVAPDRLIFSGEVQEVTVPGLKGELGILPGHAPLISELHIGQISYTVKGDSKKRSVFCSGGFVEVLPDKVSVLAEVAERPEEIDAKKAESARQQAEHQLYSKDPTTDFKQANLDLQRARTRLKVANTV